MPDVIQKLTELEYFMRNLSQWTGKKINSAFDIYNIYMTLESESSMNLPLPTWTKNIYPTGDLLTGTLLEYKIMNYNQEMRRINGGKINDSNAWNYPLQIFVTNQFHFYNKSFYREKRRILCGYFIARIWSGANF